MYMTMKENFPLKGKVVDFYLKSWWWKFKRHDVGQLVSCDIEVFFKEKKNNEEV